MPVSWVARDARELVYAPMGCEAGGDGTVGISGRDQGQCCGVRVRAGSVGPVAAEDIAAGGGGAVAGDPGGMRVTNARLQRVCNLDAAQGSDSLGIGGEGGIRTHGADNRTTAFEFEDSHAGLCRPVLKRVL